MIGGVLGMGRRFARAKMRDTCRIVRYGAPVWDEATLSNVPSETIVYEGPCGLLLPYRAPTESSTPGQVETDQMARLSLPVVTSTGIRDQDEVRYLTSASDPDLPGKKFTVSGYAHQSDATARRVPVREHS
ncbi:DUF6093 family protein [Arthrobacter sp. UYCu723]